ncbi:MAG: DUF1059 domain-containing protein [Dehalococcoidia bacterium]|nr:DUF1059 domain-containing protein [Dehalococcoidia bacterium]
MKSTGTSGEASATNEANKEIDVTISINCKDFDVDCDHAFGGNTLQELVHSVQRHAVDTHEWTIQAVSSPDFVRMLVSVLRKAGGGEEINPVAISEWIMNGPGSTRAPDPAS